MFHTCHNFIFSIFSNVSVQRVQMISERALKGQTDKVYFCTSLVPRNVIPSGSLALLLLQERHYTNEHGFTSTQRRAEFCQHNSAPELLADMGAELKKQAAARHPGLCGHPHAWVIATVKTQDVEIKWDSTIGNKYRNQGRLYFYLHCMRAP